MSTDQATALPVEKKAPADEGEKEPAETTRIHVTNLPWSYTDEKLKELFSPAGEVVSASVVKKPNGDSKGFGFVEYKTVDDAKKAIAELNNQLVNERCIGVIFSTSQGPYESTPKQAKAEEEVEEGEVSNRLHVRQLAWKVRKAELEEAFAKFGELTSCRVVKNKRTGRSKGYGFVEFVKEEDATKAKENLDNTELLERPIKVLYSKSLGPRKATRVKKKKVKNEKEGEAEEADKTEQPRQKKGRRRLFVKNIGDGTTEEQLNEHFSKWGEIEKVLLPTRDDKIRGFGFIQYKVAESADEAKEKSDKTEVNGSALEVYWARGKQSRARGPKQTPEHEV